MAARHDHRSWTEEELDALRQMRIDGEPAQVIAHRLGRSVQAVNNRIAALLRKGIIPRYHDRDADLRAPLSQADRLGIAGTALVRLADRETEPTPSGPPMAELLVPQDAEPEDEEAFLRRMLHSADRSVAKVISQRTAVLRIAADQPVAIALTSDWHIAPTGTDLRGLLEFADAVRQAPRTYCLAVGDLTDNPIKHKGGSVLQVADELRMLDLVVGRFAGRLAGMVSGNHDDWSKTLAGVDNLAALARRHRIHYAPDELLWQVEIVDPLDLTTITAVYYLHTRHQWRRGSALNPAHACWTWWQEEAANWPHHPDVLAIGHNHVSVVESRQFAERDVWALRIGTWQIDSPYARQRGFARYRSTCPTVVLPPTRAQRIQCFADLDAAVQFMAGYDP